MMASLQTGVMLTVSHYNARLLSLLDNDEPFLVHEELAAIDNAGIRANKVCTNFKGANLV